MRFLVDMPLSPRLCTWLTERGHDAIHASTMGLNTAPDDVLLERARHEDRIVITADLDFPRILAQSQANAPGVILFREGDYSHQETVERLMRLFEIIPAQELATSVVVIEKTRIRRRRLPL